MEEKNMKKTYIIPTVKVVKVKTNHMLRTSMRVYSSQELESGEILSRGTKGDMWDDEDEDY